MGRPSVCVAGSLGPVIRACDDTAAETITDQPMSGLTQADIFRYISEIRANCPIRLFTTIPSFYPNYYKTELVSFWQSVSG